MTGGDKDKPNPVFRVYNSMTKAKEDFTPLVPGEVKMYVCGVTAYDLSHIGHARAAVNFDVLFRYLMHLGYEVTYVRNFTDVDDKIIHRANEAGEDPISLSNRYCEEYLKDMGDLQCLPPTHQPCVSEHIKEIKDMITKTFNLYHELSNHYSLYPESGMYVGFLDPDEDAHVVGDCVKHVLRELPSSPVPASCCAALLEAYMKLKDLQRRLSNVALCIEASPHDNVADSAGNPDGEHGKQVSGIHHDTSHLLLLQEKRIEQYDSIASSKLIMASDELFSVVNNNQLVYANCKYETSVINSEGIVFLSSTYQRKGRENQLVSDLKLKHVCCCSEEEDRKIGFKDECYAVYKCLKTKGTTIAFWAKGNYFISLVDSRKVYEHGGATCNARKIPQSVGGIKVILYLQ